MADSVVVVGAGYAGARVVHSLQERSAPIDIHWISDTDYHFVLHEAHRIIRNPGVASDISIPVGEIADRDTAFTQAMVVDVDTDDRTVVLDTDETVSYDYLVVAVGSQTAYYGIPGMAEHAYTLKSRDDALGIHEQIAEAGANATPSEPSTIAIGGAGLSGIQSAGEVAEYRDATGANFDIVLIEAMEEIMPGQDPQLQQRVREKLAAKDIEILTDDPITEATAETIEFDERDALAYDFFLWTGGITGRDALDDVELENSHNRLTTTSSFETSDDRVFALGDAAIVDQGENPAPPTAQAAWQSGKVVAENVIRSIRGKPLEHWTYEDKGTLISIGDEAVAHDVIYSPVETFNGTPAETLKKVVAARWIASVSSWSRSLSAWSHL